MEVVLHGVRGSSAAPGPDFVRVGGNTSCVAVTPDGEDAPTLLLDAGTGLSSVDRALGGAPYRGDILLTHLHWDHVQGLPFFTSGDRDDAEARLLLPAQEEARVDVPGSAAELLARSMSPPHFPITPAGLRGKWQFEAVDVGVFEAGGCRIVAREVPHKGGRTFGFRIECDGKVLTYLPDHHPDFDPEPGIALAAGADVLCHGAMFRDNEHEVAALYGHATLGEVTRMAREAAVHRLVLIHHSPKRTDDQVEAMVSQMPPEDFEVVIGREGDVILR